MLLVLCVKATRQNYVEAKEHRKKNKDVAVRLVRTMEPAVTPPVMLSS